MKAVKRFFKDNIVYAVLMLIALQCIMYTTGQTKQVTFDQQLKLLGQAADDFQNAYIALGLNPDKTEKKDFITTPAVKISYSAQFKPSLPFEKLKDARTILQDIPINALSADQRTQLNDILENINISLINFLMIADNTMLQKIIANALFNKSELIALKEQAGKDSAQYKYAGVQDYIDLGLTPNSKITNKLLEETSVKKITSNLAQAKKDDLNRALNAITGQSMWAEFNTHIARNVRSLGIGTAPEAQTKILQDLIKNSMKDNRIIDEQKLADNFKKLSKEDQKAIYTLIILKPAMNIDIELEAKKKSLGK